MKSLYDPSPAGWRIPDGRNYFPLFTNPSYSSSTTASGTDIAAMHQKKEISVDDGGAVLYYDNDNNSTYFRFTGYQIQTTQFSYIGQKVNLWCADRAYRSGSGYNNYYSTSLCVQAKVGDLKAAGGVIFYNAWHASDPHPVHCIQEEK
ncbi:MAG: hypothetical protein LUE99_14475 [Bacteroides sp.]|nr:hypothetical protein [Bacteroides sp.]